MRERVGTCTCVCVHMCVFMCACVSAHVRVRIVSVDTHKMSNIHRSNRYAMWLILNTNTREKAATSIKKKSLELKIHFKGMQQHYHPF